jgi:hypothetical protein
LKESSLVLLNREEEGNFTRWVFVLCIFSILSHEYWANTVYGKGLLTTTLSV